MVWLFDESPNYNFSCGGVASVSFILSLGNNFRLLLFKYFSGLQFGTGIITNPVFQDKLDVQG